MSNIARANETVDGLMALANEIEPEYSESCADTGCTNRPPETDAERLVSLLHRTALALNASGLCDRPGVFERWVDYRH